MQIRLWLLTGCYGHQLNDLKWSWFFPFCFFTCNCRKQSFTQTSR